jgi:hypothetical protein
MKTPPRAPFTVYPVHRAGIWLTDHRRYYKRARFSLAELQRAVDAVLAVWPADAGDGIRVGDGPPGLHELCLTRDTLADTVVLLSAMAAEAFLNYYGVVRLGDEQFNQHFERLGTEKKLCVLLLVCDGLAVRFPDPLVAALRTVMERRNRLAHPKAETRERELTMDERLRDPLPESVAVVFDACTEFFRLFVDAVPRAAHLVPDWRGDEPN